MNDDERPDWQSRLARLRATSSLARVHSGALCSDLGAEALMTIVAIMKDHDDPKLQMAAAKMLLDKNLNVSALPRGASLAPAPEQPTLAPDDIDAAIALAKAVLDELATRKTQQLDGQGQMAADGTPRTDHPAR